VWSHCRCRGSRTDQINLLYNRSIKDGWNLQKNTRNCFQCISMYVFCILLYIFLDSVRTNRSVHEPMIFFKKRMSTDPCRRPLYLPNVMHSRPLAKVDETKIAQIRKGTSFPSSSRCLKKMIMISCRPKVQNYYYDSELPPDHPS
jgi:hypothetical protein